MSKRNVCEVILFFTHSNTVCGNPCMAVEANVANNTIYYHIDEASEFEDVESLEDYNVVSSPFESLHFQMVWNWLKNYTLLLNYPFKLFRLISLYLPSVV